MWRAIGAGLLCCAATMTGAASAKTALAFKREIAALARMARETMAAIE